MRQKISYILIILLTKNICFSQKKTDCDPLPEAGGYWYRYQTYNPYSYFSYESHGYIKIKYNSPCKTKYDYVIYAGMNSAPYDTMRIIINSCYPDSSQYTFYDRYEDSGWPNKHFFEGKMQMMDTMVFSYENGKHILTKYRVVLPDSQLITLYMNDSLGLVKKYGSYRSISADNIEIEWKNSKCPQSDFIKALLRALYYRSDFHERYDFGPRTIRGEILDKKKYRQVKRMYKKKKVL